MITLPAPLLVALIPIAAAIPAFLLRRWRSLEVLLAVGACLSVLLVLSPPVSGALELFTLRIEVGAPLVLMGRVMRVGGADRLTLALLFGCAAFLFALSRYAPQGWPYVPVGLVMLSLFSMALLIRPFLFSGLAFEAAAAFGAVMIQAERVGTLSTNAASRYLILSTLALPAFLGAGYVISQAAGIADPALQLASYQPAALLMVSGVCLLAGAIPIYTWISGVSNQASPLTTAFFATIATGAAAFLLLSFNEEYAWFASAPDVRAILTACGIGTAVLGGVIGWAQRSYSRILACGLSVELGAMFLMLASGTRAAVEAAVFSIPARAASLCLFGVGLTLLRMRAGGDDFQRVRGLGRRYPWVALGVTLGGLSLAGLPGTVGFVTRWLNMRAIGDVDLEAVMILLLAGVSVGWAVLRGAFSLLAEPDAAGTIETEPRGVALTIAAGALAVVALGLWPGLIAGLAKGIAMSYTFYR